MMNRPSGDSASGATRVPAGSVLLWLLATGLLAVAPVAYFVTGASDEATDGTRIGYAAIPMILAWLPLSLSFGLIQRKRTGRWGLPLGSAGRRALALLLVAAAVLAVTRSIGVTGTIQGDGAWTLYWLICLSAWMLIGRTSATRAASR